jgi:hypothetical protein
VFFIGEDADQPDEATKDKALLGFISRTGFKVALTALGLVLRDHDRKALRKSLDGNNDKKINYEEFKAFIRSRRRGGTDEKRSGTAVSKGVRGGTADSEKGRGGVQIAPRKGDAEAGQRISREGKRNRRGCSREGEKREGEKSAGGKGGDNSTEFKDEEEVTSPKTRVGGGGDEEGFDVYASDDFEDEDDPVVPTDETRGGNGEEHDDLYNSESSRSVGELATEQDRDPG